MNKNELLIIALFINTLVLAFGLVLISITPIGWGILVLCSIAWGILIVNINS